MRKVFKFQVVNLAEEIEIYLSKSSQFCAIAFQGENPCIWFEVHPDSSEMKVRRFRIFPTGASIGPHFEFKQTFFSPEAEYVFHLYEDHGTGK